MLPVRTSIQQRNVIKKGMVVLIMLILSLVYVLPFLKQGRIPYGDDIAFNVNRIQELTLNMMHGNWYPYMYTYRFNNVPDPLGIFYPQLTMIPYALFCLIFKNDVTGICLGIAFYTFIAMVGAYWVARKLNRQRPTALIIAVVYTFSAYRAVVMVTRFDVSEFVAMTFIPITLYGLYAVMCTSKGSMVLGLGLSLILMSHVLSALLCTFFLVIEFLALVPSQGRWRQTITALLKSACLFLGSSLIWLGPFLEHGTYQKYAYPVTFDLSKNTPHLMTIVTSSFNNSLIFNGNDRSTVGIIILIAGIWGLINYRHLDYVARYSLILGIVILLVSTSLFPWNFIMKTPFKIIQFSFRLLPYSTVFLSLVAGNMFEYFYQGRNHWKFRLAYLGALMLIISPWYTSVYYYQRVLPANSNAWFRPGKNYGVDKTDKEPGYWHLDDYEPKGTTTAQFKRVLNHQALVDGHIVRIEKVQPRPNIVVYKDRHLSGKSVTLPIMMYKNVQVWQNNRMLDTNSRGLVHLHGVNAAPVEYRYVPSVADKLSIVVSLITWGGAAIAILCGWIENRLLWK